MKLTNTFLELIVAGKSDLGTKCSTGKEPCYKQERREMIKPL